MTSWYCTNNRPAAGSRAIIKHVDDFRAVHNLESLADLTAALARIGPRREEGLTTWQGHGRSARVASPGLSGATAAIRRQA